MKKILMPTDGSACSEAAIRQGLEYAKALNAEVTFLYALEDVVAEFEGPAAPSYYAKVYKDLKYSARETLAKAQIMASDMGVEANSRLIEHRRPAEAIHDAEKDVDLVVMGTHGRRGFNRVLFGSVAEEALRRSSKPFLMVRSDDAHAAGGVG